MKGTRQQMIRDISTECLETIEQRIISANFELKKEKQTTTSKDEREEMIAYCEYVRANGFDKHNNFL
ncbi:MAG: hypothetical protein WC758_05110 [Candidatus Woesearchaeota archaeon]|jgi:hypothetical protein